MPHHSDDQDKQDVQQHRAGQAGPIFLPEIVDRLEHETRPL